MISCQFFRRRFELFLLSDNSRLLAPLTSNGRNGVCSVAVCRDSKDGILDGNPEGKEEGERDGGKSE